MHNFRVLIYAAAVMVSCSIAPAHCYEYGAEETTRLVAEMIMDIGGTSAVQAQNGKVLRCVHRGTKTITIHHIGTMTSYLAEYGNCQENGRTRDGIYEIVLRGEEIVSSNSRRSKNGELFDAAMDGDGNRLKELILAKADVNYTETISKIEGVTIDEWTPLMSAVVSGNLENVKLLVSAGAWVNYLNSLAVNALWIAANNGRVDIVRYLADHGGYVDNRNKENVTPLMVAAMNGHVDVARFLISARAKLDYAHKDNDGDTALMFSLANRHSSIARLLVEAGADVNIRNRLGVTALHIAASEGDADMVQLLLAHKADAGARTANGLTALDIARAKGYEAIGVLLTNGVESAGK